VTVRGFGIVQTPELERAGRGVFEELCDLVSEASGVAFEPTVARSYQDLADGLSGEEIGLAWLPPIPTIELESRDLTTTLAIPMRNGSTSYHSALVVRRGGPRSVDELRGRRAVWVQRESAAGYIVPRMHLAAKGIDILRFFSRELFVESHSAVIDAVVGGEADVGATYCHVEPGGRMGPGPLLAGLGPLPAGDSQRPPASGELGRVVRGAWMDDERRSIRPIEVLATFGPIPNDAVVASNTLSAAARSSVTRWLLDPKPRARELLARFLGSGDFRVPSPLHFDSLRHTLRAVRARGEDALPSESRTGIRAARRVT
jgi:phosphonate transport system substrate-binding protein